MCIRDRCSPQQSTQAWGWPAPAGGAPSPGRSGNGVQQGAAQTGAQSAPTSWNQWSSAGATPTPASA
eukprot:9821900-Alexandrium_andersonii.AAC.1